MSQSVAYLRRSGQLRDLDFILSHFDDVDTAGKVSANEDTPLLSQPRCNRWNCGTRHCRFWFCRCSTHGALGRRCGVWAGSASGVRRSSNTPAYRVLLEVLPEGVCAGSGQNSRRSNPSTASWTLRASIGAMPLLMPTNDESALFVARQRCHSSRKVSCFRHNPVQVVWSLYNKKEMYFLAKRLSIPTPETVFPESRKDVLEFCEKAQFPVMLKASDNIRTVQACRKENGDRPVERRTDRPVTTRWKTARNPSLMIQEYIPGRDDSVWMLNGYFDEHSECLFSITAKEDPSDACLHGHDRAWSLPSESGDRIGHEDSGQGGRVQGDPRYRIPVRRTRRPVQTSRRESQAGRHVPIVCRGQRNGRDSSRIPSLHWTAGPASHMCIGKEMDPGRCRSRVVHSVLPRWCL